MTRKILVWGNGGYYQERRFWIPKDWIIEAYIHGNPPESQFEGKKVIYPYEIRRYDYDLIIVAVTNYEAIVQKLIEMQVDKRKIVKLDYYYEWFAESIHKKSISMFYMNCGNVGDILNAFLLEALLGIKTYHSSLETASYIGVGSILDHLCTSELYSDNELVDNPITILGSGFMKRVDGHTKLRRPVKALAVRGLLSKKMLEEITGEKISPILADLGLLASLLPISSGNKHKIGIIPHYVDYNNLSMRELYKEYDDAIYIDVRDNPLTVISQISSCDTIISSSLHGLIIADSFGIPNSWIKCSDKIKGNDFKFGDYYSSYGLEIECVDIRKNEIRLKQEEIVDNYIVKKEWVEFKQLQLMDAIKNEMQC